MAIPPEGLAVPFRSVPALAAQVHRYSGSDCTPGLSDSTLDKARYEFSINGIAERPKIKDHEKRLA